MFNRASQWVSQADLGTDFSALLGRSRNATSGDMRAPLSVAETTLGRFFFIHKTQARQGDIRLGTYEFLHATFGEFLIARFIIQMLDEIAARDSASRIALTPAPTDDDLLYALLSFAVISVRTPIIGFLAEMMSRQEGSRRNEQTNLLKRLFHIAHDSRSSHHLDGYHPRHLPATTRHAAYSANLMLLAICSTDQIAASELFHGKDDVVGCWFHLTLLWRSQCSHEWFSLVRSLALYRVWNGDQRDILISLNDGTFEVPAPTPVGLLLRNCQLRMTVHMLSPTPISSPMQYAAGLISSAPQEKT